MNKAICVLAGMAVFGLSTGSAFAGDEAKDKDAKGKVGKGLPSHAEVQQALKTVITGGGNGGLRCICGRRLLIAMGKFRRWRFLEMIAAINGRGAA
jgi:hypothetical protein